MGFLSLLVPNDLKTTLTQTVQDWLMLKHSRAQEQKADVYGLKLLYHHYGHVNGADHFFARMASKSLKYSKDWFSSHPASNKRVKVLNDYIDSQNWSQKEDVNIYSDTHWGSLCRRDKES